MVRRESIPADTVRLTVSPDRLRQLPNSAAFRSRKGRAAVELKKDRSGNIVVYATCDSLQQLCEYYMETSARWQRKYAQTERSAHMQKEKISEMGALFGKVFFLGILIGIITTIVFTNIKKRKLWQ